MSINLTKIALFILAVLGCKDDLRVKVVGRDQGASTEFAIDSPANLVTRETYTLAWSGGTGRQTYDVLIARDATCSDVIFKKEGLSETSLVLDTLADGQYFLCVFAVAKSKRIPAANNGVFLTIDTANPSVSVPLDTQTFAAVFNPALEIKDLSKVSVIWSQVSGPGTVSFGDKNSNKPQMKADVDGIYKVKAVLTDEAGNSVEQIFQFSWDQIGPSVVLAAPLHTARPVAFSVTADSTAKSYAWSYSGGPVGGTLSFSDSTAKAPLITASAEGTYQVTLKATDSEGNFGSDTKDFTWDVTPPVFVAAALGGPASDGFLNAQDRALSISLLGAIDASGYSELGYKLLAASGSCDSSLSYAAISPLANSSSIGPDGPYQVCVSLKDEAGNISYGTSPSYVVDTAPALFTSIGLVNDAADGSLSIAEHALSNDLVSNLISTDAFIAEYALVTDGAACSGPLAYSATVPKSNDSRFIVSSDYRVCVRVRDQALNAFAFGQSPIITFIANAPTLFSLAKTGAGSDSFIADSEKAGVTPIWVLNQSGATLIAYTAPLDDTAGGLVCDASKSYGRASIATASDLLSDGPWAICVKLRDATGNLTYGKSDSITRDTVYPVFTSFVGTGLASDGAILASEKNDTGPAWLLSASGLGTTAYTSSLDDSGGSLVCNAAKTYDQATMPTIASLSSDGTLAICAKLVDAAGNSVYGKSTAIERDSLAPVFTSLLGANEAADGTVKHPEASSTLPLAALVGSGYDTISYTAALSDNPTISCDGSKTYNLSSVPLINSLGADDTYAVCVKLSDNAGNVVYGKSQSIVKDSSAPVFSSLLKTAEASDGFVNSSESTALNPLWTLTASGAITTSYSVPLDDAGAAVACNAAKTYSQASAARASDIASDGTWIICVKLDDGAGLVTYGKSEQVIRDTGAPSFISLALANAASDGAISNAEKLLVSALYTLNASGQTTVAYTLPMGDTGGSVVCDGTQTFGQASLAGPAALASDGLYALCVKLSDAAGNITYGKSAQVARDTAAPTFTSLNAANAASDGSIKSGEESSNSALLALSAAGYTTATYTLALDDSTPIACDGTQTYGQSSIPLISSIASDGTFAVCVKLADAAGNVAYGKSQDVVRDIVLPTFTSLLGTNEASDGFINNSEKNAAQAAWVLSASGHTGAQYTIPLDDAGGGIVCNAAKTYSQGSISAVSGIGSDGAWAICVKLTDAAGNASYGKSQQILRDVAAPVFTSLLGTNEASDGAINSSEAASTSDVMTLSASGYTAAAYTLALDDTTAVTCDNSQTYGQSNVPTIASLATDALYAVCVKLTDGAGNVAYGKSQQITRDTVPPSFVSLTKAAEGSDGYINNSEKTAANALWTLSASGATSTAYSSALDDTSGALVCNSGKTYDQGTTVAKATDLGSDGPFSLCVKLSDAAGNIIYGKGDQIVRDTVAPTFTSLARANAASDGYVNDSEKALTSALWTLSAAGQTATDYSLALDDTAGALVCDGSKTYAQASIGLANSLSSDGAYALCVRLGDASGNLTYGKSAQVIRDIVYPVFTSLNGANEAADLVINNGEQNSSSALYTLTASGQTSSNYTVGLDDTGGSLVCNAAKTYSQGTIPSVLSIGSDGVFAVCAKLSDAAGNVSYGKSQQVDRNVGGPGFTSLLGANEASDGYVNNAEKASTSVAWALVASNYVSADYTLPLDDTSGAAVCDAGQTYGQSSIPHVDALTSDKPWAICVKLVDGVANITYGKSQQIIRDIAPPTFTSLNGANAASDAYINATESSSSAALATLSASAYDTVMYTSALDDTAAAITCNGSQTYDQAAIALTSDLASDKPWALCVKLSDAGGNITYGKSQQIIRDTASPSFTSLVKAAEAADGYVNDAEKSASSPLWTLTASGQSVTDYTVALDDTGAALVCNSGKTYNQGSTLPTATSISTDGTYSVCVRLTDNAGNISYGKGQQIARDIVHPTYTSLALANAASDGSINNSEKLLVSALWSLSASGQTATDYTSALDDTGGALVCNAGKTYDQSSLARPADLSSDGPYALCVRLSDAAGNTTYGKSTQLTRDVTAPTFTSLNGANEASDLFIKSGEEASNFALYALSASGASSTNYTVALSDNPVSLTCDNTQTYNQGSIPIISSLTVDGKYAACVKLADAAGNITYGKSQQVSRDIVAPVFTSLLGANGASDGYINNSEKTSTSAAWALIGSGQSATDYTLPLDDTSGAVVCDAAKTYDQASIAQIADLASDGPWALCVRLSDAAGNITYGKSQQLIRDIIVPTFTSLLGANGASDGFISNSESASTAALFTLSASAYDSVNYTLALDDTSPVSCDNSQTFGQSAVANINALTSDSSYAVCVKLADTAGNIVYGKSQQIVKDTSAPSFTSLAKTAEGSDGYINNGEKSQTNAIWTLSASGQSAINYTTALSDTGGTLVCDGSKTYNQGTSVPDATGLSSDGAWALCVKLSDAAGNITYGKGDQIVRDIVAPVYSSLALANAASDGYINDSEKLLVSVMWTLSASGQAATDYTTALSDTAGALVCDGSKTYDQTSIATPSSLSADGAYALCVRLTDSAGNIAYGKSVQLTRDIVYPGFTSLAGANEASDGYIRSSEESSVNPLYTLTASGQSTTAYTVALDDSGTITCNSGKTYGSGSIPLINSVTPDGTYAVCVKLSDAAGNITYGKSSQIIRDVVAPVFTSLNLTGVAADGYIAYGERNSATAGWTLSASGQATTNYTAALDDTSAQVACNSGKTYSNGSIPLINSITSDGPWAICVKLVDAAGNITYGKSQQVIRDIVTPAEPTAFTATAGNSIIDLKWTASTGMPTLCGSLGPGYDLINNAEWMAIGSNAAALGSNWSSGTVGTGALYIGHSDSNPAYSCPASADDSAAYVENTCRNLKQGQGEDSETTQRRTLNLSNGNVIWDVAGNEWEIVNYYNLSDKPTGSWVSYPSVTPTVSTPLKYLIPTNAIKSFWNDSWTQTQGTGIFYAPANGVKGQMGRGGNYNAPVQAGIFLTSFDGEVWGDGAFRCVLHGSAPNTPKNFLAAAGSSSVSLTWDKSGSSTAGYLLVRGQTGKLPLFQPSIGTTYTTGTQGNDTILYVGIGRSYVDTARIADSFLSYRVYAYDSSHNYSSGTPVSTTVSPCPAYYVLVPGDTDYGTNNTCIMKYEAKNDGANHALASPWGSSVYASISQQDSQTSCQAIGPGYHLVTNSEYMTAAANIAALGSNWTGASVGSGKLMEGHTDNSPSTACQPSSDDTLGFVESTCTPVASGGTAEQRRTFNLSNGAILWDLGGNILEYVNYINTSGKATPTTSTWTEYTSVTGSTDLPKRYLVPTHAVKAAWTDAWTSTQGIGNYYANGSSYGTLYRGGNYSYGTTTGGLFAAYLGDTPTSSYASAGFRCALTVGDMDSTTLTLTPSATSVSAAWTSTGATGYMLVRGPAGNEPTFVPDEGTSYSASTQGSDSILYVGSSLTYNNTSLTAGSTYYYALYSYDGSNNYTVLARDSETPTSCPSNYVFVPGDKDYSTQDFCVMKYEAKNNGSSAAISQAASTPWVSITQELARTKCAAIGMGYDLISNSEWMTLGANVAAINGNWTGGTVGSGTLFSGHNDSSPNSACAASSNDALFYVETNCTNVSTGDSTDQRRTLTLSNSEVVWDIAGNVWDWTNFFNKLDIPSSGAASEYSALSGTPTMPLRELVPTNSVKSFWSNAWNSTKGIGYDYAGTNGAGGTLIRGGAWAHGTASGVFAAAMDQAPTATTTDIGFRCTLHAP